jgi:putative long chain acyl-CoA synthase
VVIDFGAPEHEVGGLERTMADHILAISEAVDQVCEVTGRDVHLAGYSQGGVFAYAVAAYRRGAGVASVITFGSPVDIRLVPIFSLPGPVWEYLADRAAAKLGGTGLPGWVNRERVRTARSSTSATTPT